MQLIHFTAAENIPALQAEGLKPAAEPKHGRCSLWWPHDCVWFTRELVVTWWDDPSLSACFVLVVLSSRFGPARVVRSPTGLSSKGQHTHPALRLIRAAQLRACFFELQGLTWSEKGKIK